MSHTFLLEIGLEEIPAHVVTPSVRQLKRKVEQFLRDNRLAFGEVQTFSTPRRLAVKVIDLADKQTDVQTLAKGPAKKIAQDADGNWTKAAQGFARGQKVSVDDIIFKELKGTQYAYINKFEAGQPAAQVMPAVKEAVTSMKFPTMMRWGNNDFEYVRPLRWLVALLDEQVIDFNILDIKTGRTTAGHRFLGHNVELKSANDYPEALLDQKVIADASKRKAMIVDQIKQLAADHNWNVQVDPDLLEEVNNLVEYPTVFAGNFADKYLKVPDEVLITSMKDHQRFFYVTDANGKLLPHFVSVRNGNRDHLEEVVAGNEKVLTARLEDAKFFFEEDQQKTIADYVARLKKVMFHDKIGTMAEKMQRVGLIADFLAAKFNFTQEERTALKRASSIYKFDLVTGMVGEFAELQGVMGSIYARLFGEDEAVAQAIVESYEPTAADGKLPTTKVGALLAVADKLDSIQAFFSANMLPTGSNDPYALRRQALGVIRISQAFDWTLSAPMIHAAVATAFDTAPDLYAKINPETNQAEMDAFFFDRIEQLLGDKKVAHDVVAATTANHQLTFAHAFAAAQALQAAATTPDFKAVIESLSRVVKLARKADSKQTTVDANLFENPSEKGLADAFAAIKSDFANQPATAQFKLLTQLHEPIATYFDATMVMAKDEQLKNNRLAQLQQIAELIAQFAAVDQLIVK